MSPIRLFLDAVAACVAASATLCAMPTPASPGGLAATLTLRSGVVRVVTVEGVGCSETICSRVAVTTCDLPERRAMRAPLKTIAAVREITDRDALFVFTDGHRERRSVVHDNRVLYLRDESGASVKVDLSQIRTLEFDHGDRR